MSTFSDPPLSLDKQIEKLASKGLIITNQNEAKEVLSYISYFRLKLYSDNFKDRQTGYFFKNIAFDQITSLYFFDRELKLIIFNAIENIEIAIKTLINNTMCEKYGSHWFEESTCFRTIQIPANNPINPNEVYIKFDHSQFLLDLQKECTISSNIPFISNYKKRYTHPTLPPSWMILEILTFGTISKIYEHIDDTKIKEEIATHFSLTKKMLTSWLHCLTNIRNICAHHSRLVYTTLIIQPKLPSRDKNKFLDESHLIDNSKVYCILSCIQFLLTKINPKSLFKGNLLNLINNNSGIDYPLLGFTPNWTKEKLWQ